MASASLTFTADGTCIQKNRYNELGRSAQRALTEWSLTDCIFFVVMTRQGITEASTGDHHFEQAGFVALLK